jgi:hypothetical protein
MIVHLNFSLKVYVMEQNNDERTLLVLGWVHK